MTIDNPLLEVARKGIEARSWWDGNIGREVEKLILAEISAGVELLKRADPNDPVKIFEIQNQINMAEAMTGYITNLINAAAEAVAILQDQEN